MTIFVSPKEYCLGYIFHWCFEWSLNLKKSKLSKLVYSLYVGSNLLSFVVEDLIGSFKKFWPWKQRSRYQFKILMENQSNGIKIFSWGMEFSKRVRFTNVAENNSFLLFYRWNEFVRLMPRYFAHYVERFAQQIVTIKTEIFEVFVLTLAFTFSM